MLSGENRRGGQLTMPRPFTDTPDMTAAFRQELLGLLPPLPLPKDAAHALALAANDSEEFGLSATSFTPTIRWREWRRVLKNAAGYSLMGTAPAVRVISFGGVKKSSRS
ncbi:hypothetical protein KCP77_14885 [Salmonella enterica subsp. enterica]|nr:hypothetical protein KCP77_14885 [Salmonella enterica subsp. enterica]